MSTVRQSQFIFFPEPNKIELGTETVQSPGRGQVLCQAEKSLISIGTESYCLRGDFDPGTNWAAWVKYPFRPGYSMAARVVEVGDEVEGLNPGDRVALSATHQQFLTIRPEQAHVLPDATTTEDGTWASLACTAQLGVRRAALELGETVGVVGAGMVGQLVVQDLALFGARRIIVIDLNQGRLDRARAHGATDTVALDVSLAREEILAITGGKLLDVVFDVTGNPAVLAPAIQLVRRLGRVVLLGDTPNPTQQYLGPGVVSNSIAILGMHGTMSPPQSTEFSPWSHREMTSLFFDYVTQGRMCVADLVTHRHAPDEAPAVYERLQRDRPPSIGVIFEWPQ